jgi:hypothetical protein
MSQVRGVPDVLENLVGFAANTRTNLSPLSTGESAPVLMAAGSEGN